ncbi:hypothetical protein [Microbacterium gallinarum]|uniref:Uncharacterized protein n=1 Tax=Microbacterium gallinarum TaxID=2762209 RepID=A0ABR8X0W3_9MICO|nr:hypothetical protein [Microbacterium gallinarum]MBD8022990.1 hypothetical protein [Microbacterium gallinarum]
MAVTTTAEQPPAAPTFESVAFAHPVSLESALTVTVVDGAPVQGYHLLSDSIVGDFFPTDGLSVEQFLDDVESKTGTVPEVTHAYLRGEDVETAANRTSTAILGEDLPKFDAPDADPDPAYVQPREDVDRALGASPRSAASTWQPNDVEAMIEPLGSDNLSIVGKYYWWGDAPFASPVVMADHWGMEFQFDFYTTTRPNLNPYGDDYTGFRPFCGTTSTYYKDWAVASTRPYTWTALVIVGPNLVAAPANLGMYGDFNDLSDPCNVSTIAVGMANPWAMPMDDWGQNSLVISYYPERGSDTQSVVGAIVQPVNRLHCEVNPTMPLMDCMGVTPGSYPGPGPSSSRVVLNNGRGWKAPSLCWYSGGFGADPASRWTCGAGF